MASSTQTQTQNQPVQLAVPIFILHYRKGGTNQSLQFSWPDKQGAIEKAQEYCKKRDLRFLRVDDWLYDIQKLIDFEPDEGFKR